MKLLDAAAGCVAALSLPLQLRRANLGRLMAELPPSPSALADLDVAIRVSFFCLRVLARLRLPLWRNTCLFRSILRCLLLRRAGRAAVLRIGATRKEGSIEGLAMHAWVELQGEPLVDEATLYTPLRGAGIPA